MASASTSSGWPCSDGISNVVGEFPPSPPPRQRKLFVPSRRVHKLLEKKKREHEESYREHQLEKKKQHEYEESVFRDVNQCTMVWTAEQLGRKRELLEQVVISLAGVVHYRRQSEEDTKDKTFQQLREEKARLEQLLNEKIAAWR